MKGRQKKAQLMALPLAAWQLYLREVLAATPRLIQQCRDMVNKLESFVRENLRELRQLEADYQQQEQGRRRIREKMQLLRQELLRMQLAQAGSGPGERSREKDVRGDKAGS